MTNSKTSWLYSLTPFPGASSFMSITVLLAYVFYSYHQLNFWCTFNTLFYKTSNFLSDYIFSKLVPEQYSIVGYAVVSVTTILIFISALYNQDKYEGFRYILAWIGSRVFPILRIILELNVAIASMFMIIDPYSTILFVIAAFINIIFTFLLQNYSNSKDYLNCNNLVYVMILKLCFYANCIASSVGIWYQSEQMANVVLTIRLIIDLFLLITYFFFGIVVYRHTVAKFFLTVFVLIHFSISLGQWMDQIFYLTKLYDDVKDIQLSLIILIVLTPFTYSAYKYISNTVFQKSNIRKKCFFVKDRLTNFSNDIVDECFIRGLVIHHIKMECTNPLCFSKKQFVYDSKRNKLCDNKKIAVNKSIFANSLMKCWFEESSNESISSKIDYAQLMFFKLKNTFQSVQIMEECKNKFQFPLDKLRLTRLRQAMVKESKRMNKQLYNDELDIEFIIESEKKFEQIKTLIYGVLKRNLQFWQTVHHNKIDLTQLLSIVDPNFSIMEEINENWKDLAKYFDIQKKWKFYYAWFTLYVRNQKLKPILLEFFSNQVKQDELFNDSLSLRQSENSFSRIIFEQLSAVIHTDNKLDNPIVKKVNSYFTKLLGYTEAEIIESPLSTLMTDTVAKIHPQVFYEWAKIGRSNSEANYSVSKNYVKHKSGNIVPVQKYIKQFVTESGELEYVALLRTLKDDDLVMLVDQNMNIEGITAQLYQKLNIQDLWINNKDIRNLSILLLIPKIIKYSSFSNFVTLDLQQLFEIERDIKKFPKLLRKQSASPFLANQMHQHHIKDQQSKQDIQCILKSEVKIPTNIKLMIEELVSAGYLQKTLEKKFELLKNVMQRRMTEQYSNKYICQIKITPKSFPDGKYYEIRFNQLTNLSQIINNRYISSQRRKNAPKIDFQVQDFHRFFQGKENGKVYSLQAANNIFIKQDNNKPVKNLEMIKYLKNRCRYFFLFLIVANLVIFFYASFVKFASYTKTSKQLLSMNNYELYTSYYEISTYGLHYYNLNQLSADLMTPSFFQDTSANALSIFDKVVQFKKQVSLKQSLFDSNINLKKKYIIQGYDGQWLFLVQNISYDQIYLPIKMFQVAQTIVNYPFDTINYFTQWYLGFYQLYIISCLVKLTETAKAQIYNVLTEISHDINVLTAAILVVEGGVILFGILICCLRLRRIMASFTSIMDVFTQFNQEDIQKIYKYCYFLTTFFQHLKRKDKQQKSIMKENNQNFDETSKIGGGVSNLSFNGNFYENQNNNININKKIKKVEIGSALKTFRIITFGLVVSCLLLYLGGCFYCTISIRLKSASIQTLYEKGSTHFKYYSTLTNIQAAVQKKFLNNTLYANYYAPLYVDQIHQITEFKMNNSRIVATPQNFSFVTKYNTVYFQNVCTSYSSILKGKADITNCQAVAENSLKYGVQSFVYYFTDKAVNFLNNSLNLTYSDINKFDQGLKYVNLFMTALADDWNNQFNQVTSKYRRQLLVFTLVISAVLLSMYLILFQLLLVRGLNNRYQNLRRVYDMYMPDYLVTKEKIIKAKLIVDGILHK